MTRQDADSGLDGFEEIDLVVPEPSETMQAVSTFHRAFGLPCRMLPTLSVGEDVAELRLSLLVEELDEYRTAVMAGDLEAIADALADIVYVSFGAAITYGIDLDAVLREVHQSNMSKLDKHGRPVYRGDGKVVKSDQYRPPNVGRVLAEQAPIRFPVT